jgi:hypothetical protein
MRTASGHIHIGWTKDEDPNDPVHFADCCALVKQLDYFLGLHSILWDRDNRRRSMYGKAGAFRPKPYGVEYRVMSNVWLTNEELMRWVFDQTHKAVDTLLNGENFAETHNSQAAGIINSNEAGWEAYYRFPGVGTLPKHLRNLQKAA